jgi:biotin carboxylase
MTKYRNKGVLVIGGGILQQVTLDLCRKLSLKTFLVDGDVNCYSKIYADHFINVDFRQTELLLNKAKDLKERGLIHAVFTQGTDAEHLVAYLAKELDFHGMNYEAAMNCNNKLRCRKLIYDSSLDKTPYFSASSKSELKNLLVELDDNFFPCYIKPVNNSASRGVKRVLTKIELLNSFEETSENNYGENAVIVEKEIFGNEISVDSIVINGIVYPCGISDRKFLVKNKYAIQTGSVTPSSLAPEIQSNVYEVMQKAATTLQIDNGAFKGDLIINENNEIGIIEFAGRTSGGFDSQFRKPLSFGIDIIKAALDLSLGIDVDFRDLIPKWNKWSSTFSVVTESGQISEIIGFDRCLKIKGVYKGFMTLKSGDTVSQMKDCAQRFNYFICVGSNLDELKKIEAEIANTLKITIINKK